MKNFAAQLACQFSCIHYGQAGPKILPGFIVIEGIDGAGSTTQSQLLEGRLRACGIPCERSSEPSSGSIGKHIRAILQERVEPAERAKLAEYFAADRAEHIGGPGGIEEKIQSGIHCISERYLFSSLVYQGLDSDCPQSLEEIWQLNQNFPLPQHFFYLDIPSAIAEGRIRQRGGREIFEREDFLEQVRQAYQALIARLRQIDTEMQIHILDARHPQEELQQSIWRALQIS